MEDSSLLNQDTIVSAQYTPTVDAIIKMWCEPHPSISHLYNLYFKIKKVYADRQNLGTDYMEFIITTVEDELLTLTHQVAELYDDYQIIIPLSSYFAGTEVKMEYWLNSDGNVGDPILSPKKSVYFTTGNSEDTAELISISFN